MMTPSNVSNTITPLAMDDSPSSSCVMKRRRSSLTVSPTNSCSSHIISATTCSHCGTTTTPLWRRAPNGDTICNACGLYLKTKHTMRPLSTPPSEATVTDTLPFNKSSCTKTPSPRNSCGETTSSCKPNKQGGSCGGAGQCNGLGGSAACAGCPTFNNQQLRRQQQEQQMEGLVCANCRTTTTPLWRRDDQGNTICNACGLYYKLHKVHRPVSMKRNIIKRRKRMVMLEQPPSKPSVEEEEAQLKNGNNRLLHAKTTLSPIKPPIQDDTHSEPHTVHSIPAIEDFIGSSRFPPRPSPVIPNSTRLSLHLPSFALDRPSSSSSILLPPIHALPTPPSPPLSISSLLSSPSASPASSPGPAALAQSIQRLDLLNQKIAHGQYHPHHLSSFITQLDHLLSQAESTLLQPPS